MTIRISRRVKSRLCRIIGVLAAVTVTGAGLSAVVPVAASAAAVPVHRHVVPLVSPRLHRPVPKVPGRGGFSGRPAKPPRELSEIVADRTATSSTWRDAGGALTVREYAAPHFYRPSRSSGWQPIVTSLSPVAGRPGWFRSGANSWLASFGPGGAEQVSANGAVFGFTPRRVAQPRLAPSVSGSQGRWTGLWPDAGLAEYVNPESVTEDLVLTGRAAAASYAFALSGVTARGDRAGGLKLLAGAKVVATVPPVTVSTAESAAQLQGRKTRFGRLFAGVRPGRPATAGSDARLSVTGGQVVVSVSRSWLESLPASAFPVVIDPSLTFDDAGTVEALETCLSAGGCVSGEVAVGENSSGDWDGAAYLQYPALPTPPGNDQPWEPSLVQLSATCGDNSQGEPNPCYLADEEVLAYSNAENNPPASYSAILDGVQLSQNTSGAYDESFLSNVTPWMPDRPSGSWFGFAGSAYTKTSPKTPGLLTFPDIYASFTYYQEPPAPQLTAPAAGSVLATATPTLAATSPDQFICNASDEQPGLSGGEQCDSVQDVEYEFQISTSPTWGSGQIVADSGWIQQACQTDDGNQFCTSSTSCASDVCPVNTSWTVPPGALSDGVTYYATVQDTNSNQNPETAWPVTDGNVIVPPAGPSAVVSFTVKLQLGAGGTSPTDTVGAPPGQTSVPSQGAPSPGLSPASETVNMVTGNLALAVGTPSMTTLSGPAGVTLTYNSLQSSTVTGSGYGLTADYYLDPGDHEFPAQGSGLLGTLTEPDIDITSNPDEPVTPPIGSIPPDTEYLAQWTGQLTLPSGNWQLGGIAGGGMRIYLNGSATPVFNDWSGGDTGGQTGNDPAFETSQTLSGSDQYQIEVQAWVPPTDPVVQLWADQLLSSGNVASIVTSPWLTPVASGVPPGWSLGATAPVWTSATDLGTQVVVHAPDGSTETFTNNDNGSDTYTPQPGVTDSLTVTGGLIELSSAGGYNYTFNPSGQLQSMTSVPDAVHPTDLLYYWGLDPGSPSGDPDPPVVLTSILDPVSAKTITLLYGSQCSGAVSNGGGLLCEINYWNNTQTFLEYNSSNNQLAEVINPEAGGADPTPNISLFGYDSDGRIDDIRDALANAVLTDAVPGEPTCSDLADSCLLDTWVTYDSNGRVTTVTQPQPAPGQPRPERTYAYYPSSATPGAGATTVSIAGFSPQGAPAASPCTQPVPGCSPAGVADTYFYDAQARIYAETGPTGLTSYTTWDADNQPIITVSPDGEQTSTVYDAEGDVTDSYGPSPVNCFDPSTVPSGLTLNGPAVGYLPLTGSAAPASCNVPQTQTGYDQNMNGLAETYYPAGELGGAPALYGFGDGSDTSTTSPSTCAGFAFTQDQGTSANYLCADWPAGTTPQGVTGTQLGTDANDQWSLQMTGTINLPSAGNWLFCVNDNQAFTMDIDGSLELTNILYELGGSEGENYDFQGAYAGISGENCEGSDLTAGPHTVAITLVGSPSQATSYEFAYFNPANNGPYLLPLSWLTPNYGLTTTTIDPDGDVTTDSYSNTADGITPTYGLVTSTTQDPQTYQNPANGQTIQNPNGLNLTTSTTYQNPAASGSYLQKTATTLPAGNQTTYTNYGGTSGPVAAACGVAAGTDQLGLLEQLTGPAPGGSGQSRVEQFVYNANGTQAGVRIGDPNDIGSQPWQCTSYDTIGRITSQTWPATATAPARTVAYSYNVGGNPLVSSVSDTSGTITATEDLLGRNVSYTDALGQTTTTAYNQAGQTTASDGPGGSLTFGYDSNSGNPTTTTEASTLLATASYNSAGQLASVAYGNGTQAAIGYDNYGNQNSLTYSNSSTGQTITADSVTYTPAGRWAKETASQGTGTGTGTDSISYGYDGAGRLTSADDIVGGTTTENAYSYAASPGCDAAGEDPDAGENTNISSVTTTVGSTTTATSSYCYNTADQLVSSDINGTASASYSYSEDGDQTNDNQTAYSWDASDRVTSATTPGSQTISSTYDALNRLIESSTSGSTAQYSYAGYSDSPVAVLNISDDIVQQLISLPGGVTEISQSSGDVWDYTDLQGDTTATTNSSGTLTSVPVTYNPWGVLNPEQTAPANATGPNTLGAYATSGKLTNTATGTILLGARTFNPTEARFLSVDPVEGGCANAYTYAFGDPLTGADLTGQQSCSSPSAPSGPTLLSSKGCHGGWQPYCDITASQVQTLRAYLGAIGAGVTVTAALIAAGLAVAGVSGPAAPLVTAALAAEYGDFSYHVVTASLHNWGLNIKLEFYDFGMDAGIAWVPTYTYTKPAPCVVLV
jgi:RHS repeat-associated protein